MGGSKASDIAYRHENISYTPTVEFLWEDFKVPHASFCVISNSVQRTFKSTNHHYFNLQLLPLSRFLAITANIWQSQKEIGDVLQAADEAEAKWFPLTASGEGDKKRWTRSFICINHSTLVVFLPKLRAKPLTSISLSFRKYSAVVTVFRNDLSLLCHSKCTTKEHSVT